MRGPAATDVHHNFVQRWNEASERDSADGAWPSAGRPDAPGDLPFPTSASKEAGEVPVQITRTIMAGLYANSAATPGGEPFPIAEGEQSALEQYLAAV